MKRTKCRLNAKVIAVSDFNSGLWCISCNTGYIKHMQANEDYEQCTQCPTTLLLQSCNLRVSALLTLSSEGFQIKLMATNDILSSIAELPLSKITDLSLLSAPPFTVVYNNNMTTFQTKVSFYTELTSIFDEQLRLHFIPKLFQSLMNN